MHHKNSILLVSLLLTKKHRCMFTLADVDCEKYEACLKSNGTVHAARKTQKKKHCFL